jgi:hypothetical protein
MSELINFFVKRWRCATTASIWTEALMVVTAQPDYIVYKRNSDVAWKSANIVIREAINDNV